MDIAMTSRSVVDALTLALGRREVTPGLIVHSDRGSQYCSEHYQRELALHGLVPSMSRRANCCDNAVAESTFGRLKVELTHQCRYADTEEAKSSLFEYVEGFWNRERRHSTLGYLSPAEYERSHHPDTRYNPVHFPWGRSPAASVSARCRRRAARTGAFGRSLRS